MINMLCGALEQLQKFETQVLRIGQNCTKKSETITGITHTHLNHSRAELFLLVGGHHYHLGDANALAVWVSIEPVKCRGISFKGERGGGVMLHRPTSP